MLKLTDLNFLKPSHCLTGAWMALVLLGTTAVQAQPSGNYLYLCAEGQRCYVYSPGYAWDIAYGAENGWDVRTGITGTFVCGDSGIFNSGDPKPKKRKACYISQSTSQPASVYTTEGNYASVPANTSVWYGADGRYTKNTRSGQFKCGEKMGDPYPKHPKFCFTPKLW